MILGIIQVGVDVVFALGLTVLAAAHLSGRTFSEEWAIFTDEMESRLQKLESKVDNGSK